MNKKNQDFGFSDHPKQALQLSRIVAAAWSVIRLGQTQCWCWYPNSCFCDVVDVRQGRGGERRGGINKCSSCCSYSTSQQSPAKHIASEALARLWPLLDGSMCREGLTTLTLPFIGLPADPLLELSPYTGDGNPHKSLISDKREPNLTQPNLT